MIGKISGRLDWRGNDHVLIDVRGVGYIVYLSERNLSALPPLGANLALYTELVVREDLLQLYGFSSMLEKEWHKLLTTVQGVGAKAALAIIGVLGTEGAARAITLGDAAAIQSAPGVGPKLAQRVVLELKAKAPALMAAGAALNAEASTDMADQAGARAEIIDESDADAPRRSQPKAKKAPAAAAPSAAALRANMAADALSALVNLDYNYADAAEAVSRALDTSEEELDVSRLIRAALRRLAPQ